MLEKLNQYVFLINNLVAKLSRAVNPCFKTDILSDAPTFADLFPYIPAISLSMESHFYRRLQKFFYVGNVWTGKGVILLLTVSLYEFLRATTNLDK